MKTTIFFPLLIYLHICVQALGQKVFEVSIQVPTSLDTSKVQIYYDDGKDMTGLHPTFNNGQFLLTDTLYAKYASIEISYPRANGKLPNYKTGYFISDKVASITLHSQSTRDNPFTHISTENTYSIDESGGDKLTAFIKQEASDFWDFYNMNVDKLSKSDSLVLLMFEKNQIVLDKKTEFVRQNADSYYAFWLFRKEVAYNENLSADSLLSIFKLFPDTLQHSIEGKIVQQVIRGRSLQKGQIAPHFTAMDIKGKSLTIEDVRGKYILLNFWASWCAPCIQEMPQIRQIRFKYPKDQLEVLFFTLDKDTSAFKKSVKKNDIGWGRHFFASNDHIRTFGAQAIPQVYLINPKGIILYNRDEENDYDLKFLLEFLNSELQ